MTEDALRAAFRAGMKRSRWEHGYGPAEEPPDEDAYLASVGHPRLEVKALPASADLRDWQPSSQPRRVCPFPGCGCAGEAHP